MPSTNKTPLGLNQWIGTDKPKKDDFNNDNQIIDIAIQKAYNAKNTKQNAFAIPGIENPSVEDALDVLNLNSWNKSNFPVESGTWTPVLAGYATDGSFAHIIQRGTYITINKLVLITCTLRITNVNSMATGELTIKGLPYAPAELISACIGYANGGASDSMRSLSHIEINPASNRAHTKRMALESSTNLVKIVTTNIADFFPAIGAIDSTLRFSVTYYK